MPIIDENNVEFNDKEKNAAWENAVLLNNVDKNEYRMCWICKFHMKKEDEFVKTGNMLHWIVDLIDAKHKPVSFESQNLIAVHAACSELRQKLDARKIITKIKSTQWGFDTDFYETN